MSKEVDCFTVIRPFVEHYANNPTVQIIGGVGTAALCSDASEIDLPSRTITVPDDFTLSTRRSDGTLRDVDVLVLSPVKVRVQEVRRNLSAAVGTALEPSVFGIRPAKQLMNQLDYPLHPGHLGIFLGDRYEQPDGGGYARALFPFMAPLSHESLEPWSLMRGDMVIPVPNPATSLINYFSRSITGLRHKDADKVNAMATKVFGKCPELSDYIQNGPLQNELEFVRVIGSLARSGTAPLMDGGQSTYAPRELMEHRFFMPKRLPPALRRIVMHTTLFKARGLEAFESNPAIVTLWQKYMERFAGAVTGTASS